MTLDPTKMTDAVARSTVIKALRRMRASYRTADTAGEKLERELDRLIKRKTRINSSSLMSLTTFYDDYQRKVEAIQGPFTDALNITGQF